MCVTEIRLSQKSDLRGGKPVSDMIFIINRIIISDMMFK